jgi:ribosomal protein L37AE/L43A
MTIKNLRFEFTLLIKIGMKSCPECGSKKLKYTNEGLICGDCGTVIEESIYSGERIIA